jgi:transcriptional regulator with XRE-family HTH domain
MVLMGIGTNFKTILTNKNFTVQGISRKTGISPNTLYGIIKRDNETVKPDTLEKLANALGVPVWELMGIDRKTAVDKAFAYKFEKPQYADDYDKDIDKAILEDFQEEARIEKLLKTYKKLNNAGKYEAIKRIEELCLLDQYKLK